MDDEARAIVRMQDGDEDALRELYEALAGHVFALALRMTGDREDAEEVLQDTFVSVHRHARRFRAERGSARAWVYAIARNAARMRLRARDARPAAADGASPDAPGAPLASPPLGAHGVDRLAVRQAFDALSHDEGRLLTASFFAGYSHAEIAEREGVPLGTIKSRIRRALLKARGALEAGASPPAAGEERDPS